MFPSRGFEIIDGFAGTDAVDVISRAYDAFASGPEAQVREGSTSTRLDGITALAPFYRIYLHAPLLDLAFERLGERFKLSSFCAKTLRAQTPAPPLHQDVRPGSDGDSLVGFILMVDAFTEENGATRLVSDSRDVLHLPADCVEHQACGPAGSLLIFDGATWHEHGANRTNKPRRSIQGYFVGEDHAAAVRWSDQLPPEQLRGLPPEARGLLCA